MNLGSYFKIDLQIEIILLQLGVLFQYTVEKIRAMVNRAGSFASKLYEELAYQSFLPPFPPSLPFTTVVKVLEIMKR